MAIIPEMALDKDMTAVIRKGRPNSYSTGFNFWYYKGEKSQKYV